MISLWLLQYLRKNHYAVFSHALIWSLQKYQVKEKEALEEKEAPEGKSTTKPDDESVVEKGAPSSSDDTDADTTSNNATENADRYVAGSPIEVDDEATAKEEGEINEESGDAAIDQNVDGDDDHDDEHDDEHDEEPGTPATVVEDLGDVCAICLEAFRKFKL